MDFYVPITCIKNGPFGGCFGPISPLLGPCRSLFALFRPDMAQKCDIGCSRAFVGAAPIFFALQVLHSGRFALFAASRGLLCGFTWLFPGATFMCFYVSHPIHSSQRPNLLPPPLISSVPDYSRGVGNLAVQFVIAAAPPPRSGATGEAA